MVDGRAILWSLKKQELVTLSTTEAEYVAVTHAAKEAVWLQRLLGDILTPSQAPTTLFGNNQSAITLAHGGQYHAHMKHINIQYHFIRYIIKAGSIKLIYCPTNDQTADTLTKAFPSTKAKHFADAMGLCSLRGSVEVINCLDSTGTLCVTRVVALWTTSCSSLLAAHILYFLDFRIYCSNSINSLVTCHHPLKINKMSPRSP